MKAILTASLVLLGTAAHAENIPSLECAYNLKGANILTVEQAERGSGYDYWVTNKNLQVEGTALQEVLNFGQLTSSDDSLHGSGPLRTADNLEYMSFEQGETGYIYTFDFVKGKVSVLDYSGNLVGKSSLKCQVSK